MYSLILLALVSFLISYILTPFVRDQFRNWNLMDQPDGFRHLHSQPIPRVGGIAIAVAFAGAFAALIAVDFQGGWMVRSSIPLMLRLAPAVGLMFAIGLADDLRGLPPWQKLSGQIVAAALAISYGGVEITGLHGHGVPHWLSLPLTLLWLIGCTNAVNLIDGVDGLAAGVGLFATITTLVAALIGGNYSLAMATVPLAGALLAFLRFNFNPASIFLGDCGSLPLGFLLGIYAVLWSQKAATVLGMITPLMALVIPLLDTGLAILRRFLRQQPIFGADLGHIHHKLLSRGFTPRRVALVLYAVCGVSAALSLMSSMWENYIAVTLLIFCAGTWLGIQNLGYVEFGTAQKMIQNGSFRRLLSLQICLAGFRERVDGAKCVNDVWEAIKREYRVFGFQTIEVRLNDEEFNEGAAIENSRYIEMVVPLDHCDFVRLEWEVGRASPSPTAAAAFAEEVGKAFPPRLRSFRVQETLAATRTNPERTLGIQPLTESTLQ